MSDQTDFQFQAETGRVLDLVINSLYTNRDIFLRELISNAADACDKLRYAAIANPELADGENDYAITIATDEDNGTLSIADNGIGMNRDELIENLGTIARSGTSRFLETMTDDSRKDVQLIGQFGVGFYAAFMVADKVQVTSRKAGDEKGWIWESDGRTGFSISEVEGDVSRGTTIQLFMKKDDANFLKEWEVERIVRAYSDHIALPIRLISIEAPAEQTEDEDAEKTTDLGRQINAASALWRRDKNEITDEQYTEFYRDISRAFDEPFAHVHFSVEGMLTYSGLLFLPGSAPFDLYDPNRHHAVKLYVKRVLISDKVETLLPRYLRFVSGVVDSEDLTLNVSRETLQNNAVVQKIRKGLVNRVLGELKKAANDPERDYTAYWESFGAVLKEGLYEDSDQKDKLLGLLRFKSTHDDAWQSIEDYKGRMKEGQDKIYYMTGESLNTLRASPQLEACRSKGVEVILFTDAVDDFWIQNAGKMGDFELVSLTRGDVDLSGIAGGKESDETSEDGKKNDEDTHAIDALIAACKINLGDHVADVRVSKRLTESPVCLIASDMGHDLRMERILRQTNQIDDLSKRVLEINPDHSLIKALAKKATGDHAADKLADQTQLLLDQARIIEGEPIVDPGDFVRRMNAVMEKAL